MICLRFAIGFGTALLAWYLYSGAPNLQAVALANGPVVQATSSPMPEATPAPTGPQPAAPVGEGTQGALMIVGLVALSALAIGGGIYLRRRWIATRY